MKKNKKKNSQQYFLKTGDQIKVLTGNFKGMLGKILSVNKNILKASIEIINESENEKKKPFLIHFSNIQLWDPEIKKSGRIGYKIVNQKKLRYFKKSGNFI